MWFMSLQRAMAYYQGTWQYVEHSNCVVLGECKTVEINLSFLERQLFYHTPVSAENRHPLSAKPEKGCLPVFYKEAENGAAKE